MRVRALALAGLSTVLLTACSSTIEGSASPDSAPSSPVESSDATGPELSEAAIDALEQAGSVHIAGSMTMDGEPTDVDLRLSGDDVAGNMTVQGSTVQIVVVDGAFYMQAPAEMWSSQGLPPAIAANLATTWVLVPGGPEAFGDLSFDGFIDELRTPGARVEDDVTATELDGRPVWELHDSEGTSVLVAATGEPYPLQVTNTGPDAGAMRLSEFGTVEPIDPPTDYLDLDDLGG